MIRQYRLEVSETTLLAAIDALESASKYAAAHELRMKYLLAKHGTAY